MNKMAASREEKEAFISGLSGTDLEEMYLLLMATGLGVAIRHSLLLVSERIRKLHQRNIIFSFIYEFITVMLPALLSFTVLSDSFIISLIPLQLIIIFIIFIMATRGSINYKEVQNRFMSLPFPRKPPFLTVLRTWVNIYTSICILAVDFHIFPRRFAKTESYGTGLMDIGVGMFIINHGIVAKETRQEDASLSLRGYMASLYNCIRTRVWVFIILGLVRLVTVSNTDYQQHVSEYGVHWNFFFTTAAVRLLSTALQPFIQYIPTSYPYATASVLIGAGYQCLLSAAGLRRYILEGPGGTHSRDTIISANREGLFSCVGYLAIYYTGVEIGRMIFMKNKYKLREKGTEYFIVGLYLLIVTGLCIGSTVLSITVVEPVSRRMANLSFIIWIVSITFSFLTFSLIIDLFVFIIITVTNTREEPQSVSPLYSYLYPSSPSSSSHCCLISAIDYNQFIFFLIANVSTGIVNITINTMSVGPILSFLVLSLHIAIISLIIIVMNRLSLKII